MYIYCALHGRIKDKTSTVFAHMKYSIVVRNTVQLFNYSLQQLRKQPSCQEAMGCNCFILYSMK